MTNLNEWNLRAEMFRPYTKLLIALIPIKIVNMNFWMNDLNNKLEHEWYLHAEIFRPHMKLSTA